jgi:hypothetical protein
VALADLTVTGHRPRKLGPIGAVFVAMGKVIEKAFVIR